MITIELKGRLGNQLFQLASAMGIAYKKGLKFCLKEQWAYAKYFILSDVPMEDMSVCNGITEKHFHYASDAFFELFPIGISSTTNYSLSGYFQSEKYWKQIEHPIRLLFQFKEDFVGQCRTKLPSGIFNKPTIGVCIRRGDYVGHKHYYQIPISYYITALQKHFPNFLTDYNIIFFSDDIAYAKLHFGCLPNAYFSEGNTDIEDLCLISQFNNHILGNSTFHWWGAYLSDHYYVRDNEPISGKVIRPDVYFAGESLSKDIKDFWIEDWISHSAEEKIDLLDTTFVIPYMKDSNDREENLNLTRNIIFNSFETNVSLIDIPSGELFHRTKMINRGVNKSTTPICVNYDCDVILPPMQLLLAVIKIREGKDVMYPYGGNFIKLNRYSWYARIKSCLDIGVLASSHQKSSDKISVGGCVVFNKESFIKVGMENENFISFGPEDKERFIRFLKLGLDVDRVQGNLYHINHYTGHNSNAGNPNYLKNVAEYRKVKEMSDEELVEYVKTWSWTK
jgi:Glycosyl transferase family 11/N-terminal domain of galactosyltransferase